MNSREGFKSGFVSAPPARSEDAHAEVANFHLAQERRAYTSKKHFSPVIESITKLAPPLLRGGDVVSIQHPIAMVTDP